MPSPDRNKRHATIGLPARRTGLSILHLALLAFALSLVGAGCQRASPPVGDAASRPAPTQRAPSAPVGIGYRCADGSTLDVAYAGGNARVHWPDGRTLTLPRAESASKGGGDVYVGAAVSLRRDGNALQLHDGDAPALNCGHA
jgi:membrane-bound inhibitor of C-type lysozyme